MFATKYTPKSLALKLTDIRDSHFQTQSRSKSYVRGLSVWARGLCILLLPELQVAQSSGQGYYVLGILFSRLRRKPSPTHFPSR